jgi:alpha-D-ribose 1-methylphosphonate 5-triphosphate synthase subunit PhnL
LIVKITCSKGISSMNIKMEIFDNTGKLVFSKINIIEKEFKLAPSCLCGSGMYHVRVTSSLKVRYAKLIID